MLRLSRSVGNQQKTHGFDQSRPPLSVELHTIVTVVGGETRWAYDLHAVAQSEEELVTLKPVLDAMLRSVYLSTPTVD